MGRSTATLVRTSLFAVILALLCVAPPAVYAAPKAQKVSHVVRKRLPGITFVRRTKVSWLNRADLAGRMNWDTALRYISRLNVNHFLGYNDWRLPSIDEYKSLIAGRGKNKPYRWLKTQGFRAVKPDFYWSSTNYQSDPSAAWVIYMGRNVPSDNIGIDDKSAARYFVWPVRSGK